MRNSVRASLVAIIATALLLPASAGHTTSAKPPKKLDRYAADTWRSVRAMVYDRTGLPADNVGGSLAAKTRAAYTSPTNIGAYLWSTVSARDLGLIGDREAKQRMARTIRTVGTLERHEPSACSTTGTARRPVRSC
jgi:hypothetical protein